MCRIAQLSPGRIRLYVNENDHPPPHLHMYCAEGIFKVFLGDLSVEVVRGSELKARVQIRRVRDWMTLHSEELKDRWNAKERGEKVKPIE